ncbi:MAG: helix-turn-helix transcriptional regulator [Clostridiales bacterium]|nr:helix-turn-helix transcriptional regulator [Clostridiales bacterium]
MNNKFYLRLTELRKEHNISRSDLAQKLNVSVRLISYWENAKRECDFDMLLKISNFFSVSTDYLLGKDDY